MEKEGSSRGGKSSEAEAKHDISPNTSRGILWIQMGGHSGFSAARRLQLMHISGMGRHFLQQMVENKGIMEGRLAGPTGAKLWSVEHQVRDDRRTIKGEHSPKVARVRRIHL